MRYSPPVRLDVYPTDAEAFEAAAAAVAEELRALGGSGPLAVALTGGRSGRGVLVALAARGDLPWERVELFLADERCVDADDAQSNVRLVRDSLVVPRGLPPARVHAPAPRPADPAAMAAAYADVVAARLGTTPVFDLVLLGLGAHGEIASLAPDSSAMSATTPVAAVGVAELSSPPRVARITLTPPVLRAARRAVVVATGDAKASALAAVLREPVDPRRRPAQLVLPSEGARWVVDRAAAAELLRDARVVQPETA